MSCKPILRDLSHENQPDPSEAHQRDLPVADRRPADAEMARVLKTAPLRMASDPSSGAIAHWKHDPLHDVVEPMTDHVIMAYNGSMQRMERRSGKSVAIGTFRPGVVIIIPAGSSSRWDIPKPVDVVQLYLPHTTLERVADEADTAAPIDLLERTGHPDPITSRLLLSAADALEGNASPGCPVQAAADGPPGHAPAGCAHRLANHVPADHGRAVAEGPAPRHRTPALGQRCGRLSRGAGCRMPACRASTSAVPSRKAPGFRRMPGCASTGSSRP